MAIRKIIKAGRDFIIPILDKYSAEGLEKRIKDAKDNFPVWTRAQCEQFGQILYENVITSVVRLTLLYIWRSWSRFYQLERSR